MSKNTAIIIGGGFAGIAAAIHLDALGYAVTLIERKPLLGGRAYAFQDKKTGSWVDNGQHLMMGAYHETLKLFDYLGVKRHLNILNPTVVPLVLENGEKTIFKLTDLKPPLNLLRAFLNFKALTFKDKLGLVALQKSLQKNDMEGLTVTPWLKKLNQSEFSQKNFWDILTLATLNDDPKRASASMLAVVLAKGILGSVFDSRLIIAKTHLSDILANPAEQYLTLRGHKVIKGCGVKKIHVLDNKVQMVETDKEHFKADLVVSSLPPNSLLPLIPEGFVEKLPYFSNLKKIETAPIVSINLWFDRPIMDDMFVGAADKKVHWWFDKNRISDITHPPYHYMGVISGAYDLLNSGKEEIMAFALSEFKSLFPKANEASLIHSLVNKEVNATMSITPQSDKLRPPQKSPFDNFYVIGDWTQTGYPATIESAVLSAKMMATELS
ncbi:hydroxysqualene dehydroxylase HpnE [bacterium]|nr:hydroxysqualene dehydroxylase HpnE [bacterium]